MEKTPKTHSLGRLCAKMAGLGFLVALLAFIGTLASASLLYSHFSHELPQVLTAQDYRPPIKSRAYAEDGRLIAEFGVDFRIVLSKEEIPKRVAEAFIAAEDKHFYSHHGIDFLGILSSFSEFLSQKRESLRGASTLTQQLAKGLLIKKEGYEQATARTFSRKIKEAILALRLEKNLTKAEILWMYLNEVYLGHGAYGVAAAAQNYFKKELSDLSLGQLAILAGLPQAPSRFSPQSNLSAALARQSYVLNRMREEGFITEEELKNAIASNKDLEIFARENSFRIKAPYFSEHIRRKLLEQYGEDTLYEQGLTIYTTLDLDREQIMQRVLKEDLIATDKRQGFLGPIFSPQNASELAKARGLLAKINEKNLLQMNGGYSLAMVEHIDHQAQRVAISTDDGAGVITLPYMAWARLRNPDLNYQGAQLLKIGSVLKRGDIILVKKQNAGAYSLEQEPAIEAAMIAIEPHSGYVHAMNGGYSFERSEFNRTFQACRQPGSVFKPVVYSAAIALKKYTPATIVLDAPLTFRDGLHELSWKPKNFEKKYLGEVTVREAVMNSMNIPTLNIVADLGIDKVVDWAHKIGISSTLKLELGTGIGSSCITPAELAQVFLNIANLGEQVAPVFIKEIIDRDQKRLTASHDHRDPWIMRHDRITAAVKNFNREKTRVMAVEDAYTMHYLLTEAAKNGTGQRSNILRRDIAGKTGTTNDSFDAWFAGYSKNLLSVVWVGNDTMEAPLGVYEQGGRTALPLFIDFYQAALKGLPNENFERPRTMCEARIDERSGLRIDNFHPQSFVAPFRCGEEPALMPTMPHKNLEQALDLISGF